MNDAAHETHGGDSPIMNLYVFQGVSLSANGRTFKRGQRCFAKPGSTDDAWYRAEPTMAGPTPCIPGKDAEEEIRIMSERARVRQEAQQRDLLERESAAKALAAEAQQTAEVQRARADSAEGEAERLKAEMAALRASIARDEMQAAEKSAVNSGSGKRRKKS